MIPDPAERPVLSAEEAFAELGIDRTTGYRAIRDGSFPLEVIRVGRLIRIPTTALLRLLGFDDGDGDRLQAVPSRSDGRSNLEAGGDEER
jgi:excisionase family DNA binding protein